MTDDPAASGPHRVRVVITNDRGLHARAAARFVQLAQTFEAEITVRYGGQSVAGRSILGLMMLGAALGVEIEIETRGADAEVALQKLAQLVAGGFDENDPA